MYRAICEVTANPDFSLEIVFDNGEIRVMDMTPYLEFGVFRKIRQMERFKRVRVCFDTIEWDDGVDLDPEFIYANSVPAQV